MRVCDGCGIRMPAWKPRQRNADGDLLCEGCTNGRPGRPVGHHGLREVPLACEACHTPMGELGLVVTAGKMVCPEGCKTAATWFDNPGSDAYDIEIEGVGEAVVDMEIEGNPPKYTGRWVYDAFRYDDLPARHEGVTDSLEEAKRVCEQYLRSENPDQLDMFAKRRAALRKQAHDSGDGATIYHCPFCGAGQVTARSDGTVECGFCHTYFTVQVQPQHSAQPQTINGQPVQMPGMPGDPAHADSAQQPQPQQVEDPNFAPAGSGGAAGPTGEGGFAPAGSAGKQFLPAGSGGTHTRAASKVAAEFRTMHCDECDQTNWVRQGDNQCPDCKAEGTLTPVPKPDGWPQQPRIFGKVAWSRDDQDERHDPQEGDEPCTCCGGSGEHPSGHECYRCDASGLEKGAAGECDAETMAKGALYLTPDQVAIPEPAYLAHLALRFADDRDAVLTAVRNERTAR